MIYSFNPTCSYVTLESKEDSNNKDISSRSALIVIIKEIFSNWNTLEYQEH